MEDMRARGKGLDERSIDYGDEFGLVSSLESKVTHRDLYNFHHGMTLHKLKYHQRTAFLAIKFCLRVMVVVRKKGASEIFL